MKKKIFIGMAALFFAAITFYNVQVTQQDGDVSLENVVLSAAAQGESTSYQGPLCSNQSGTIYCCKGTSGSCSAGALCSACQ
jgi:hypothetical protein